MTLHTICFAGLLWGFPHNATFSDIEPGLSEYAYEAWERMTYGGLRISRLPGYSTAHAIEIPRWMITQYLDQGSWL